MRTRLAIAAVGAVTLLPVAHADAATVRCTSADLRYPFQTGGPKTFGVFHLRIAGGSCSTAHAVAKAWKRKFEVKYDLPKAVNGYAFTELPATAAQTYRLRGVKGST